MDVLIYQLFSTYKSHAVRQPFPDLVENMTDPGTHTFTYNEYTATTYKNNNKHISALMPVRKL